MPWCGEHLVLRLRTQPDGAQMQFAEDQHVIKALAAKCSTSRSTENQLARIAGGDSDRWIALLA